MIRLTCFVYHSRSSFAVWTTRHNRKGNETGVWTLDIQSLKHISCAYLCFRQREQIKQPRTSFGVDMTTKNRVNWALTIWKERKQGSVKANAKAKSYRLANCARHNKIDVANETKNKARLVSERERDMRRQPERMLTCWIFFVSEWNWDRRRQALMHRQQIGVAIVIAATLTQNRCGRFSFYHVAALSIQQLYEHKKTFKSSVLPAIVTATLEIEKN